ncbi:MAG TPA: aminotransferase class I/II-fold pyridoxal phosphate-dependent enzyme [Anaeromyxobacter sp.]
MRSRSWSAPTPRVHGGAAGRELAAIGLDPRRALDFSVNVNPYGPCPSVVEAIRAAPVHLYPDPAATAVREAISARTGAPVDGVVFGSGAADLLWGITRVLLAARGRALIVEPAFSEVGAAVEALGQHAAMWRARAEEGLRVDLREVERAARHAAASAIYLCAPTTPAGAAVPLSDVADLARRFPEATIVLDESFLSLSDRSDEAALPMPENVARLRSMTKEHAIPGLRAGYLLAAPALARAVEASRPAWSTSSVAQAAAIAALAADGFVAESRERLRRDRLAMATDLAALGLAPLPSVAPYLAFAVTDAAALRHRLLAHGVVVRDCASFGLPGFVRVAARPAHERARLLAALEEELR